MGVGVGEVMACAYRGDRGQDSRNCSRRFLNVLWVPLWVENWLFKKISQTQYVGSYLWRKEWDSNPRYAFTHTRFPSVRLKPLGHPSSTAPGAGAGRVADT